MADYPTIYAAICACKTVAEVDACAKRYGADVARMEAQDRVRAIHLRNLAQYARWSIQAGYGALNREITA